MSSEQGGEGRVGSRSWAGKACPLVAVAALALLFRFALLVGVVAPDPQVMQMADSASYEQPALKLLATGRFMTPKSVGSVVLGEGYWEAVSPEPGPDRYEIWRLPGYPALIAGTYGIFGRHRLALAAVQAALGTLTAVLVYLLAGSLWGRPTALVAGLLAAAEPLALNYFMFILSETFFALALLAAVAVAGYALRRPRLDWRWGMLAGLLLALSAFVRPVSYFLIFPVAAGFGLVRWMRDRRWTGAAGLVVAVLVPWVLLVGAWRLRNYSVSGYGGFTFQAELNLLFGRRDILVYRDGLDKFEADRRLTDLITKNGFLPPAKLAEVARREGMRLYREHPLLALRGAASGLARTLLGPGALAAYCGSASGGEGAESALGGRPILDLLRLPFRDYLKKWPLGQPIPYAIYLFQVVFLAGVYIGVALAFRALPESLRERWPVHALLLGTVVYCLVVSANCAAYSRFRVPIMPLLCCYAAAGWTWLLSRRRSDAARAAAADSSLPAGCGEPRPASASEGQ